MRKHSMMISSIGLMSTRSPYLVQLETYISPGLPYFSVIGLEDKDRRIRERIQAACATVGYQWPACRTTMNLMPASMPKQPELLRPRLRRQRIGRRRENPAGTIDEHHHHR